MNNAAHILNVSQTSISREGISKGDIYFTSPDSKGYFNEYQVKSFSPETGDVKLSHVAERKLGYMKVQMGYKRDIVENIDNLQ
jgi:hypothetical protein